jgi:hypothetical protein
MKAPISIAVAALALFANCAAQEHPLRLSPVSSIAIPPQLAPSEGEPVKCGFPIINYALRQVTPAGQPALAQQAGVAAILARPEMQVSVQIGGFRVHYDTAGTNTPSFLDAAGAKIPGTARAFVDSIFSIAAYALAYETSTLHYPGPPADGTLGGGPECDIYVMELGNMYGYTTPDVAIPAGGRTTSSMTIDNDFQFVRPEKNRGLPGLRVTIAHELHHVIQIGDYGYWDEDAFFYEITSTWMEDVVYPEVNDYYNYLSATWGHFRNPETPFTSSELIMYSRAIWGHFVSKRLGIDVMRETWENIRLARPQTAIDQTLRAHGMDFAGAFAEWSLWNYFTGSRANPGKYYIDAAEYPLVLQSPVEFTGTSRDVPGSLRSLGTHYTQVQHGQDTMTVMMSNVDVAGTLLPSLPLLPYTLRLRTARVDDSYKLTPIGIYSKLDVTDMGLWSTWYVVRDSARPYIDPSSFSSERPFPSPFRPARTPCVYLPVEELEQQRGALYIFSASADIVREFPNASSTEHLGRQMFTWDGHLADGNIAPTGVYVFVIELPGRRVTGKIPLVRE